MIAFTHNKINIYMINLGYKLLLSSKKLIFVKPQSKPNKIFQLLKAFMQISSSPV